MNTIFPMTVNGERLLKEELEKLKGTDRPKVINDIAEARAHGDLKENAEYHAAREQQSFIEGRINQIDYRLGCARVIDVTSIENTGKVIFGTTVTLLNLENEQEVVYTLVGEDEANIKENKISISSPIARGLIGKSVEDDVSIKTPGGEINYEIVSVEHLYA